MTELDLDAIEARANAATVGQWRHTYKNCKWHMSSEFIDRDGDLDGVGLVTADINQDNADLYATDADMDFIAHARTDIPALVAEVRRLRAKREATCKWTEARAWIGAEPYWETECGKAHDFGGEGFPGDYGYEFCPFTGCGRRIISEGEGQPGQ